MMSADHSRSIPGGSIRRWSALVAVLLVVLLSAPAHAQSGPWLSGYGYPLRGIDGLVRTTVVYEGQLIAGGEFTTAANHATGGIARFDGVTWQPLGGTFHGYVHALAVYHEKLYAAGFFRQAPGCAARNIACWNGEDWQPLGSGLSSSDETDIAFTLTVHQDRLIVGGHFTDAGGEEVLNIAAFDEETWAALGSGLPMVVESSTVYQGELIAGGWHFLRRWDGTGWTPLVDEPNYEVYALGVHDGSLVAGGSFTRIGSVAADRIARWNGMEWSPMGAGFDEPVAAILSMDGILLVGGRFRASGGEQTRRLARWAGASWREHAGGTDGMVWTLAEYAGGLVAGGDFLHAGPVTAGHIACLQESLWSALGPPGERGLDGFVQALATYHGDLIAVGTFRFAGETEAKGRARWTGSEWLPLEGGAPEGWIQALAVHDDLLVAGGDLTRAGDEPARGLASWDGTAWAPFSTGADGAVCCLLDTPLGLIAGGRFCEIGGVDALHIARWDGVGWNPLGSGLFQEDSYGNDLAIVQSLAWNDGRLYAAGQFVEAGGVPAANVASWDGTGWSPVGPGIPQDPYIGTSINALAFFQGELYAGGDFWKAYGAPGDVIVRFDGTAWTEPVGGADWPVEALLPFDGDLYAAGDFTEIGSVPASRIARWTGSEWHALGLGVDAVEIPRVTSLEAWGGDLVAAGDFHRAGGLPSWNLAHWPGPVSEVEMPMGAPPPLVRLPNPYHPGDAIALSAPTGQVLWMDFFDARGRSVQTLRIDSGQPTTCWDGCTKGGVRAPAGRYFLRARAGALARTQSLILIR